MTTKDKLRWIDGTSRPSFTMPGVTPASWSQSGWSRRQDGRIWLFTCSGERGLILVPDPDSTDGRNSNDVMPQCHAMFFILLVTSRCIHGKAKARSTLRHLPNYSGISGQVPSSCHPSATLLIIAPSHIHPAAGLGSEISTGFCSRLLPPFRRVGIPVGGDVVLVVSGPVYILSGSVKRREHLVELGLERRQVGFEGGGGLFASVGGREVSFCLTFLETMVHRSASS